MPRVGSGFWFLACKAHQKAGGMCWQPKLATLRPTGLTGRACRFDRYGFMLTNRIGADRSVSAGEPSAGHNIRMSECFGLISAKSKGADRPVSVSGLSARHGIRMCERSGLVPVKYDGTDRPVFGHRLSASHDVRTPKFSGLFLARSEVRTIQCP